jgi:hypothetical protein
MIDLKCKCSHSKYNHYEGWHEALQRFRGACTQTHCYCKNFKLDNLKYLEECYEKQNLG